MRCRACNRRVGNSARCPECDTPVSDGQSQDNNGATRTRGQFRGRLDRTEGKGNRNVTWLQAMLMLLQDPRASRFSKAVLIFTVFYIISPLDLLPGGLIPIIGWLDDIIVGFLSWSYLRHDLERYKKR